MTFLNRSVFSFYILLCLASCGSPKGNKLNNRQSDESVTAEIPKKETVAKNNDTIAIVAVGDIMLGSSYPSEKSLPPDDAKNSFAAVDSLLKGDIVFGNLEGVLLDGGQPTKSDTLKTKTRYSFRMPERYAGVLKKAGFNVISIANNHIGDFKWEGRKTTAKILDSLHINYAGQVNKLFALFTVGKVRFGFCAFAPNAYTVSINDLKGAKALVSRLKDYADVVIVSFHGGAEGATYQHVTRENEIFIGENRGNVYKFAHAVVDAGADVVLGHGPHVTRAVEVYKNKFIAYSLGNFCTHGTISLAGTNGFAPLLKLKINKRGDFLFADVTSIKQDKINGLTLDKDFRAFKTMKNLTNVDFPGNGLVFEENTIKLAK